LDASQPRTVGAVVLDIEGTTTPASFVYDALFPYARANLRRYLREHARSAEVLEATQLLRAEHVGDSEIAPQWDESTPDATLESLVTYLEWLMDRDRKSPGLKLIQGHVWKNGYDDGTLRGEVYDDVRPALERWKASGIMLAIYSSGSVLGQRLLFSHSNAGDLTQLINCYFDTGVGPKRAPESYRHVADALGLPAEDVLFVTDMMPEIDAARSAGLRTCLCVRGDSMATSRNSDRRCEAPEGGAISIATSRNSDRRCEAPEGGAITTEALHADTAVVRSFDEITL
jgi:enolase-phosphatase E1